MVKPQRFWQLHLSTALVLMLVGGALLGLNLHQSRYVIDFEDADPPTMIFVLRGWPFRFVFEQPSRIEIHTDILHEDDDARARKRQEAIDLLFNKMFGEIANTPSHRNWDIAINSAILLTILILCEWRVRCKERARVLT